MKKINIILIIIIVIIFAVGGYFIYQKLSLPKTQMPTVDQTAGWETYTNAQYGFELKYPETFSDAVWRAQTWPPSVAVSDITTAPITSCSTDISASGPNSSQKNETINNMNFVVYTGSDAGAGQLYTDYCYVLKTNNKYYAINFVIHSTDGCGNGNCGPWCGTPNEQACKTFDMQKEVVQPIETIVSTFKFIK